MNSIEKERIALQVIREMNEGVMVLSAEGDILMANIMASKILEKDISLLRSGSFYDIFSDDSRNIRFTRMITESLKEVSIDFSKIVPYFTDTNTKKVLNVITSGLHISEDKTGMVVVLSDITELTQVREHLKMMSQIERLNKELEQKSAHIRQVFSRYLSDEIVEQILDKPDGLALGGKMENITVMMSDLRGFTAMCETMDPGRVMDMLNHYLTHMVGIIRKHNGTIIEYAGDGILAIFGAPIKSKNHAVDALLCALEMQSAMETVNKCNRRLGYPDLKMGIGLNTGDAIVGNMGSKYALKYNLIGACVNLCGRIEGYTVAGQVFISPYTKAMIPYELECDDQFEVHPKGISESIVISSVRGIGAPYNISIKYDVEKLKYRESPLKVKLFCMNGKHIPKEYSFAYVHAASYKQLLITTKEPLEVHDDIMLRARMDFYGKVLRKQEDGYLVEITGRSKK